MHKSLKVVLLFNKHYTTLYVDFFFGIIVRFESGTAQNMRQYQLTLASLLYLYVCIYRYIW